MYNTLLILPSIFRVRISPSIFFFLMLSFLFQISTFCDMIETKYVRWLKKTLFWHFMHNKLKLISTLLCLCSLWLYLQCIIVRVKSFLSVRVPGIWKRQLFGMQTSSSSNYFHSSEGSLTIHSASSPMIAIIFASIHFAYDYAKNMLSAWVPGILSVNRLE